MSLPALSASQAPPNYERQNESQFRREVERHFQQCNQSFLAVLTVGSLTIPAGLTHNLETGNNTVLRITTGAPNSTLTGIIASRTDRVLRLINLNVGNLILAHEDAGSTAANRFLTSTGASKIMGTDNMTDLFYDTITGRWRVQ